jgi:hypothetical protein
LLKERFFLFEKWFSLVICRQPNMPNQENSSFEELQTAAKALPVQRSYIRPMAINASLMGLPHEQLAALFGVNEESVSLGLDVLINGVSMGLQKVPRSWPDGQDEEKRKAFIELIKKFIGDHGVDLWFLEE